MSNLKFRYYLEKNRNCIERNQKESIMVEISYGYSKLYENGRRRNLPCRIALDAKILPKDFGLKNENFKFNELVFLKFSRKNRTIKNLMQNIENEAISYEEKFTRKGFIPTPKEFLNELKSRLERIGADEVIPIKLIDFLENDILSYKGGEGRYNKNKLSENTLKTYKTLKVLIDEYEIGTGEIFYLENAMFKL